MPYIDSNQDASQNDLFSKALTIGAVAIGAAAAGQMAFKGLAEKWANHGSVEKGSQVLKGLYGKNAKKLHADIADNVVMPNYVPEGPQYGLKTRGSKAPRFNRTDGSAWQRFKSNKLSPAWTTGDKGVAKFFKPADKDLAMFNSRLKDLHKGRQADYSKSKLFMYDDIVDSAATNNINITGKDAVKATNNVYSSEKNIANRRAENFDGIDDDIAFTNQIWDMGKNSKNEATKRSADINAEVARRAKAETDAKSAEKQILKQAGVIPNTNLKGNMRDKYADFWSKADLNKTEPRHPKENENGGDLLMNLYHSSQEEMANDPSFVNVDKMTNGGDALQALQLGFAKFDKPVKSKKPLVKQPEYENGADALRDLYHSTDLYSMDSPLPPKPTPFGPPLPYGGLLPPKPTPFGPPPPPIEPKSTSSIWDDIAQIPNAKANDTPFMTDELEAKILSSSQGYKYNVKDLYQSPDVSPKKNNRNRKKIERQRRRQEQREKQ